MSAAEIAAAAPYPLPAPGTSPMQLARERMARTGQWHPRSPWGRRWTIGCVALEITQRCNLDCSLCYLPTIRGGEDIPLEAVFERIDMIRRITAGYGRAVTGGDPTLRRRDELVPSSGASPKRDAAEPLHHGIKATRTCWPICARPGWSTSPSMST
jgi:hypothetical protein